MNQSIEELAPVRWKVGVVSPHSSHYRRFDSCRIQVFQVLLLDGENTGEQNQSLRDARNLVITDEQFQKFLERHRGQACLVPEDNEAMRDSYLNLDEEMRYVVATFISPFDKRKVLTPSFQAF